MQISSVGVELWHPQSTLSICYCWHHLLCGTDIGYCFWLNLLFSSWLVVLRYQRNQILQTGGVVSAVAGADAVSSQVQEWCREMHCSYSIFVGSVVQVHCCTGEWKTLGWGHDNLVHDGQIQSYRSWGGVYGRWQASLQQPKCSVHLLEWSKCEAFDNERVILLPLDTLPIPLQSLTAPSSSCLKMRPGSILRRVRNLHAGQGLGFYNIYSSNYSCIYNRI